MKFGETIVQNAYRPWSSNYLEYNALKKLISLIHTAQVSERQQQSRIVDSVTTAASDVVVVVIGKEQIDHKLRHKIFENKWKYLSDANSTRPFNDDSHGSALDGALRSASAASPKASTEPAKSLKSPSSPARAFRMMGRTRTSSTKYSSTLLDNDSSFAVTSSQLSEYFVHILDQELLKISAFVHAKRRTLNRECDDLVKKVRRPRAESFFSFFFLLFFNCSSSLFPFSLSLLI